jgi:hypothetical protein
VVPQTHHQTHSFINIIDAEFAGATTDIKLTCTYDDNPPATLTAALCILGTTLPADVLQKMFQYNLTKSGKTLEAILKENNANKHFQSEDYNAAVVDKDLTPGLEALFLGHLGPNFGVANGFNNSHPILCQIDCEAPKSTIQRRTYQWALFFPHTNIVMTCHDYIDSGKTKHAWVLGTGILDFFKDNNQSRIDRRMGKIFSRTK